MTFKCLTEALLSCGDAALKLLASFRAPAAATCLFKLVSKPITADLRRDSVPAACSLNLFLLRAADGPIGFSASRRRWPARCARLSPRKPTKFGGWRRAEGFSGAPHRIETSRAATFYTMLNPD